MTGAELVVRVRRQIRGVKNIADEDIMELMRDEAALLQSEFKLNDTVREFTLDGVTDPYVFYQDTLVVAYGDAEQDSSRVEAWYLDGSGERKSLSVLSENDASRLSSVDKGGSEPKYLVLVVNGEGLSFSIYPNVAGTYYLAGVELGDDVPFGYEDAPWGGSYPKQHIVLAYNAAAQILTEVGEEQRAKMALSNYQRHRKRLSELVPIERKPVRTYMFDAFNARVGVRRV